MFVRCQLARGGSIDRSLVASARANQTSQSASQAGSRHEACRGTPRERPPFVPRRAGSGNYWCREEDAIEPHAPASWQTRRARGSSTSAEKQYPNESRCVRNRLYLCRCGRPALFDLFGKFTSADGGSIVYVSSCRSSLAACSLAGTRLDVRRHLEVKALEGAMRTANRNQECDAIRPEL